MSRLRPYLVLTAILLLILNGAALYFAPQRTPGNASEQQAAGSLAAPASAAAPATGGEGTSTGGHGVIDSNGARKYPDPKMTMAGTLSLKVQIEPVCGSPGTPMIAKIQTTPGTALGIAVAYKDGQTYGQFGTFRANSDGSLTYPWTIPPQASKGMAKLLVGGSDEKRKESAGGWWEFLVAASGEC